MASQQMILEPNQQQFLTFEDAVIISRQLEDYFNSPESDQFIFAVSETFNLGIKENFHVHVDQIEKNCSECMGCHNGSCILGCFMSKDPSKVCYWDEAIEAVLGTKLIVHEYAHVIYDQIFTNDLSEDDAFEQSELFAQFLEQNFQISLSFCTNCSPGPISSAPTITSKDDPHDFMHFEDMTDAFIGAVIGGIGFGIGAAALTLIFDQFIGPEEVTIVPGT